MMQSEADTQREFRREFLWRFSKYTLHESDLDWAAAHEQQLRRIAVEPMFPVLRYVWNHLSANVITLEHHMPGLAPIAGAIGQYCQLHEATWQKMIAAQDELFAALAAVRVAPMAIKGAAARTVTSVTQAMTDLDLLTHDLDETWHVIKVAEQLGYPLDKVKLRHLPVNVGGDIRYHGYANLYRCEDGGPFTQAHWDLGRVRTLDLHIGRFYGPGEGVLTTDLWQRATTRQLGGHPVLVPSPEDMLLTEVLHLVRHGTLSMGTLNRVCQLLTDHVLDPVYLCRELVANDLVLMAHAALQAIAETFPHANDAAQQLLTALPGPDPLLGWAVEGVARTRRVERYGAGSAASVALQTAYVYATTRHQLGRALPVDTAAVAFARMFRNRRIYPRAHQRWNDRRSGWLTATQPAVMMTRVDHTPWTPPAPGNRVEDPALRWVSATTALLGEGTPEQTMLTPVGAFTHSRYDGTVTATEKATARRRARRMRAETGVPQNPPGPATMGAGAENQCSTMEEGK